MTPEQALGHIAAVLRARSDADLGPETITMLDDLLNVGHTITEERQEPARFVIAVRELAETLAESIAPPSAEADTARDEEAEPPAAVVQPDTVELVLLHLCPLWPLC
ncbi:hypothetical protein FE374_03330 [Georgenia yuyongxinii]|uniref:Uncharacterized protein n=1 Tax=Georgenia yuyongxinii TaxID=2589797 RepID=A0A5B8C180_9MICO|nr:hypothetical protein [Georgenia yuyongxinii]QDC23790.1 hypothetical protein FE374_03330 [Georgenia yuyongxinii]